MFLKIYCYFSQVFIFQRSQNSGLFCSRGRSPRMLNFDLSGFYRSVASLKPVSCYCLPYCFDEMVINYLTNEFFLIFCS